MTKSFIRIFIPTRFSVLLSCTSFLDFCTTGFVGPFDCTFLTRFKSWCGFLFDFFFFNDMVMAYTLLLKYVTNLAAQDKLVSPEHEVCTPSLDIGSLNFSSGVVFWQYLVPDCHRLLKEGCYDMHA